MDYLQVQVENCKMKPHRLEVSQRFFFSLRVRIREIISSRSLDASGLTPGIFFTLFSLYYFYYYYDDDEDDGGDDDDDDDDDVIKYIHNKSSISSLS